MTCFTVSETPERKSGHDRRGSLATSGEWRYTFCGGDPQFARREAGADAA